MIEIKFRLRDRHNEIVGFEKWYEGEWATDDPDKGFSLDSGWWRASPCWLYSVDGKHWKPTVIAHRYKDKWTGLLDKNGKELYEGDLIKNVNYKYPHKIIYTLGSFVGKQVKGRFQGYADGMFFDRFEVIGNIYENKELLNA